MPSGHPCAGCAARLDTFCRVLDPDSLARFKTLGSVQLAAARQFLFHEGDPARFVYNLTRGTLKLYQLLPDGRRQITGFVYPGDFIGLEDEERHAFTAEVLEPAEYCRFTHERFRLFLENQRDVGRELYATAIHELAAAREQMVLLGRKRADERLASFLLDLFDRTAPSGTREQAIRLPMTRTDIGDYLGLTKETVSRAFTLLRRRRLVAMRLDKRTELIDRAGLEQLARGDG